MSGAKVVVKVGGAAVDDAQAVAALSAWAAGVAADEPGRLVVVHGGGAAVDARLGALGMKPEKVDGLRVTPAEQIDEVVATLAGLVNTRLVAALRSAGVKAVGLTLADAGVVECERMESGAVDLGRVGRVCCGDGSLVETLCDAGYVPVVASIGYDLGGALNVNADEAAAGIALVVGAEPLVLLSDVPAVLGADGESIGSLDAAGIGELIAAGVISGGMVPKVRAALSAAEAAGAEAVIGSWRALPKTLDGLRSCGTRVLPDEARRRPSGAARASLA